METSNLTAQDLRIIVRHLEQQLETSRLIQDQLTHLVTAQAEQVRELRGK